MVIYNIIIVHKQEINNSNHNTLFVRTDTPTNEVRGVLSVHEKHLQGYKHVDITIGISTNCASSRQSILLRFNSSRPVSRPVCLFC